MAKLTKEEKSWITYDIANSAFTLILITTIMPIFFKDFVSKGVDSAISTANWGYANSLASLILALIAPILGTFADYKGYKKRFFSVFLLIGLLSTLLLITINQGEWIKCIIFFVIARVGWAGANIFYDAFLTDVSKEENMAKVSAYGFSWGYIGSVVPFIITIILVILLKKDGEIISPIASKLSFFIVFLWWGLFSIPMLKNTNQNYYVELNKEENIFTQSFKRFFKTFKEIKHYKNVMLFLFAYFFYIDGVNTIISMASAYGRDVGLSVISLILAILMIQVVAFPATLLFGKLSDKISQKTLIFIGILIYVVITFLAFKLPSFESIEIKVKLFWILALLVALSQGGVQSISRSIYASLIPKEKSTEFFGFYNIFGKFATILGPFLMGIVSEFTGSSRYGVLSIMFLFLIGIIFLVFVKIEK
ncbi:MAG: major facilitator superfamily permease [Fusobacteriales bacterium]|jgi:UMF1 family MFS transporter|nr:major facilitator superfamily permease [Fusobacteriales bacterium]